jgi:hypothetical protein
MNAWISKLEPQQSLFFEDREIHGFPEKFKLSVEDTLKPSDSWIAPDIPNPATITRTDTEILPETRVEEEAQRALEPEIEILTREEFNYRQNIGNRLKDILVEEAVLANNADVDLQQLLGITLEYIE